MFSKEGYVIPEIKLQQYKSAPAKEWQGLSNDEIARFVLINEVDESGDVGFARLIEQALKEKNS